MFVRTRLDSSAIWTYLANETSRKLSRKFNIVLNEKEFSAPLRSRITNISAYMEESRDLCMYDEELDIYLLNILSNGGVNDILYHLLVNFRRSKNF